MKKITYVVILFFATTLVANSQMFIGGSMNINTSVGKTDNGTTTTKAPTVLNIGFGPRIGFILSDKVRVGVDLSLTMQTSNNNEDPKTVTSSMDFGVGPFIRYYFATFGKFSAFGEASIGATFGSSKTKTGDVTVDGPKTTDLVFMILPGIAFNASEKVQLYTSISAFGLGVRTPVSQKMVILQNFNTCRIRNQP